LWGKETGCITGGKFQQQPEKEHKKLDFDPTEGGKDRARIADTNLPTGKWEPETGNPSGDLGTGWRNQDDIFHEMKIEDNSYVAVGSGMMFSSLL